MWESYFDVYWKAIDLAYIHRLYDYIDFRIELDCCLNNSNRKIHGCNMDEYLDKLIENWDEIEDGDESDKHLEAWDGRICA